MPQIHTAEAVDGIWTLAAFWSSALKICVSSICLCSSLSTQALAPIFLRTKYALLYKPHQALSKLCTYFKNYQHSFD